MYKLTDIAIMNRSAENPATVHMRDRYGAYAQEGLCFLSLSGVTFEIE